MADSFWTPMAWRQLWQVSVTIMGIWCIVRLCARHRPQLAYLLWMLVVIKCITPPTWDSHVGLFSWMQPLFEPVVSSSAVPDDTAKHSLAGNGNSLLTDEPVIVSRVVRSPLNVTHEAETARMEFANSNLKLPGLIAASVWFVGALTVVGRILWKWNRFRFTLQAGAETARLEEQVRKLAAKLSLRRIPRVVSTSLPTVPAVFGFLRPTIVLPEALLKPDANIDLEPILAHELVHVRRADTVAGRLQLFVQALWWFHPLVWWANFEARRERERSCDEMVIMLMEYHPLRYANCLVRIAEFSEQVRAGRPPWQPTGMAAVGSFRLLANRLEHITNHAAAVPRRIAALYLGIVLLLAVLLLPGAAASAVRVPKTAASQSAGNSGSLAEDVGPVDFRFDTLFASKGVEHRGEVVHAPQLAGITIDGKLDDWPTTMPRHAFLKILADGSKSWEGADFSTSPDLSCAFMVGYSSDAQALYVGVVVRDDKLVIGNANCRDTDAMELYVDGLRSRRTYPWRGGIDHHWFEHLSLRDLPVQQYCAIPGAGAVYGSSKKTNPVLIAGDLEATKTKMAFTQVGHIITYEWAVQVFDRYPDRPTKLAPGKRIGFEIVVVDKDVPLIGPSDDEPEADRRAWIYWGPNWNGTKVFDAGSLGEIVLGE